MTLTLKAEDAVMLQLLQEILQELKLIREELRHR
jgi:hypothetical protein